MTLSQLSTLSRAEMENIMSISNTYTTLNAYIFGTRSGHAGIAIINDNSAELLTEEQFWETVIGYLENEDDDVAELLAEAEAEAENYDTDLYIQYLESRGIIIQTIDEMLDLNRDEELLRDGEPVEAAAGRLADDIDMWVADWNYHANRQADDYDSWANHWGSNAERRYMRLPNRAAVLSYMQERFADSTERTERARTWEESVGCYRRLVMVRYSPLWSDLQRRIKLRASKPL